MGSPSGPGDPGGAGLGSEPGSQGESEAAGVAGVGQDSSAGASPDTAGNVGVAESPADAAISMAQDEFGSQQPASPADAATQMAQTEFESQQPASPAAAATQMAQTEFELQQPAAIQMAQTEFELQQQQNAIRSGIFAALTPTPPTEESDPRGDPEGSGGDLEEIGGSPNAGGPAPPPPPSPETKQKSSAPAPTATTAQKLRPPPRTDTTGLGGRGGPLTQRPSSLLNLGLAEKTRKTLLGV